MAGFGVGDIASTMRSMSHADSHQNGGGHLAVAIARRGRECGATAEMGDECGNTAVRRLTPRGAERLQGAPDDWTLVPNNRGKPMADGPRYKMLGNSFAVPVIRYIGERIAAAEAA